MFSTNRRFEALPPYPLAGMKEVRTRLEVRARLEVRERIMDGNGCRRAGNAPRLAPVDRTA